MKSILILGRGAREEIINEKLSNHLVYSLDTNCFNEIKNFCIERNIDLVIPSNETYLCNGIVDYLQNELKETIKVQIFGPTRGQALIEGSKKYSKNLMTKLNIPTANYTFHSSKSDFMKGDIFYNKVIKYSGLAKGKGVYLPDNNSDAAKAIDLLFESGNEGVIIENRLIGIEVSVMAFCNGTEAYLMPQAQDYKRVYDEDKGPNTGGMGAIAPANILNNEEMNIVKIYMDRVVKHLNYKGILYAGLMKTKEDIYFLEFNCRFGDPEAQVILNLLETDLFDILLSCINGQKPDIKWSKEAAAVVVLSHEDYPESKLIIPTPISILSDFDQTVKIYDSNITIKNSNSFTTGGRVLSVVSLASSQQSALQNIYNNLPKIDYKGIYYRRDIGCNNNNNNNNKQTAVGILASGNGTCLEKLFRSDKKDYIKLIITENKDALIIEKARLYDIPFFCISKGKRKNREYYELIVNIMRQFDIEVVILAGFMNIVTSELYDEFYTINIHPSLLPKYKKMKDMQIHELVIENKDKFSGCTLHKVTGKIDEGRILLQKQYMLKEGETSISLKKNIQDLEKACIYEFISNYSSNKATYDVNINEGNKFVELLKQSNPAIGGFCAEYDYNEMRIAATTDGCGTKIDLSNKYNKLDEIGIDLVAMNVNDLIAGGAKPLFFMDYIAIDKMDKNKCVEIIKGINKGCEIADCKLIGGETAEMKKTYLKNKFDIAGFAVGHIIHDFQKYDMNNRNYKLYGLPSSGIHSNGYTLINELLKKCNVSEIDVDTILKPTRIYTEVLDLIKKYPKNIFGIAHITGGGFEDNLRRIIPDTFNFELFGWDFPPIFKWIQRESCLNREEMLGIFNCGYGMVIISDADLELDEIGKLN